MSNIRRNCILNIQCERVVQRKKDEGEGGQGRRGEGRRGEGRNKKAKGKEKKKKKEGQILRQGNQEVQSQILGTKSRLTSTQPSGIPLPQPSSLRIISSLPSALLFFPWINPTLSLSFQQLSLGCV